MIGSLSRRALLATVLGVVLAACFAGQALAKPCIGSPEQECSPWWHVNTVYAPPQKVGGEGTVQIEVSNLGDASTNGTWVEHFVEAAFKDETKGFIRVVDKLPAGLTPTEAEEPILAEGNGTEDARSRGRELREALENLEKAGATVPKLCSASGQTVTCLYGMPVRPYERIDVIMNVNATPGAAPGVNEVSVSGGGAAPVVSRRTITPDEPAPSFGVETYELTPEEEGGGVDTQAGSHPFQLTTTLALNTVTAQAYKATHKPEAVVPEVQPVGLTKDLRFNIPPGLIGNPTPLPKCSLKVFTEEHAKGKPHCPPQAVVGVAMPIVTGRVVTYNDPLVLAAPLFMLEPNVGEPARFGFQTPVGPVILDTSVRTGGDYGVVVTVPNIINIPFLGSQVTFWGVPADARHDGARTQECLEYTQPQDVGGEEKLCSANEKPQPFLIMPTSCTGPLHTSIEADSWEAPGAFGEPAEYVFESGPTGQGSGGIGEPYGLDGCNRLSFEPSISVTPDGQQASTPTGLTVGVHVDQEASLNPSGLADSTVKDTTVVLPAGVALNPAGADGLQSCSLAEIGLESASEQTCPEAAKVGTVEIETPLLPHRLEGAAYLATQNANPFGSLIALYIVAKDPVSGVLIKLAGEVKPQEGTGQLVSTFDNTPQLPFETLRLNFFGGSRAPLGTPALCGSYTTTASIAPWSGNEPVDSSSTFQITSGPNNTPCSNPLPFAPQLTTGSLNLQAGAFTPFTMTMSREDGNQNLDAIRLKMPPGLSGELSKVQLCGEAQANTGTCGPESLIGETVVSVGLGGNPYTVNGGKVYITGPYDGAPYGLSIVNPAKAGPFDLGQVVVRAKIEVDPTTAALTITSDANGPYRIPQMIDGIPLQIKHVNVTINRPGFTFNPTNCEPMQIGGALTSSEGAVSTLHVPFQVTDCAALSFKPSFKASTRSASSRQDGASLHVSLTYPKDALGKEANVKYVKVELPKQLPSELRTLQQACLARVFESDPASCPTRSLVAHALVHTPVLPVPLSGPAYFVSHGGQKFPELVVVLQGYGVTVDLHGETFISKNGITSSTFKSAPDVPFSSFELNFPQGPFSALAGNLPKKAKNSFCGQKLIMPTTMIAQNGAAIEQKTQIKVTGCAAGHKASKKHEKKRHHKKRRHKRGH